MQIERERLLLWWRPLACLYVTKIELQCNYAGAGRRFCQQHQTKAHIPSEKAVTKRQLPTTTGRCRSQCTTRPGCLHTGRRPADDLLETLYPERTITVRCHDPAYVTPDIKAEKNRPMRTRRVEEAGASQIGHDITRRTKRQLRRINMIRYGRDERALKRWRDGQLNLAHGTETKK